MDTVAFQRVKLMTTDDTINTRARTPQKTPKLTLFYDGVCPICIKEINWLTRLNKQRTLAFQDINAANFKPEVFNVSHAQLMAQIHGQKASGELIKGMPVFRELYSAVGLGWLLAPTGWPVLKPVFDYLYQVFAKNRSKLGRFFFSEVSCDRCIK